METCLISELGFGWNELTCLRLRQVLNLLCNQKGEKGLKEIRTNRRGWIYFSSWRYPVVSLVENQEGKSISRYLQKEGMGYTFHPESI